MKRHGFTLVELLGVVIAVGMLLTLSAKVLHQAFSAHRESLSHLQRIHSIDRFAGRWREDVQSANEAKPIGESLVLMRGDVEYVYAIKDQLVIRTRRQSGQDVGVEQWRLPARCTAAWVIDESGKVPLVVGTLRFGIESEGMEDGLADGGLTEDAASSGSAGSGLATDGKLGDVRRMRSTAQFGLAFDDVELVARLGVGDLP